MYLVDGLTGYGLTGKYAYATYYVKLRLVISLANLLVNLSTFQLFNFSGRQPHRPAPSYIHSFHAVQSPGSDTSGWLPPAADAR